MSSTTSIFAIILSAVLTNNFIFSQFLGCCPFLGCSSKIDTAAGMGLAVTFVMGLASAICWLVNCLPVQTITVLLRGRLPICDMSIMTPSGMST